MGHLGRTRPQRSTQPMPMPSAPVQGSVTVVKESVAVLMGLQDTLVSEVSECEVWCSVVWRGVLWSNVVADHWFVFLHFFYV
jgi:hypothetical protein